MKQDRESRPLLSRREQARARRAQLMKRHPWLGRDPIREVPPVRRREHGQILVMFALMMVVVLGIAALVIDGGLQRKTTQTLWNALDAASLAGASQLPASPATAKTKAIAMAQLNYPALAPSDITVVFQCLVGDRDSNNVPDPIDVGQVCNPLSSAGAWVCADKLCVHPCNDLLSGVTCNTIQVSASTTVNYQFGNVVGVKSGVAAVTGSAACKGLCGQPPAIPLDIVLVLDRTASMSGADLTNAANAAKTILGLLEPTHQYIALSLIGPSQTTSGCSAPNAGANGIPLTVPNNTNLPTAYNQANAAQWIPVGLTGVGVAVTWNENNEAYQVGGVANASSRIVKAINCLQVSQTGTDLADPIAFAFQYLRDHGRANVSKGIIFETDGTPQQQNGIGPAANFQCSQTQTYATAAKSLGDEIFTIGFGVAGAMCPDSSGAYAGQTATKLLSDIATQPSFGPSPALCNAAENTDGDHFFCEPKTNDLTAVFVDAVNALIKNARLVHLPGT